MSNFRRLSHQAVGAIVLSGVFSLTAFADGEMNTPVASPGEMNTPVASNNSGDPSTPIPGEMNTPLSTSILQSTLQTLQNVLGII